MRNSRHKLICMWPQQTSFAALPQGRIAYRSWGKPGAQPLLLLHGYPQTHIMWKPISAALGGQFFCVAPDLRGYGDSLQPADEPNNAQMSKRVMAQDAVDLMRHLGHERFMLCGHDRGGRVAHRLALDHAERVQKLCTIDIAPTLDMYEATSMELARAYHHWFLLIQPAPLPEMLITPNLKAYLHVKLGGWGGSGTGFLAPEAVAEYERCYTAESIHTMCEDYRASAGIDLDHDRESRGAGQKIQCPKLSIIGARGVVHRLFDSKALWQAQCEQPVQHLVLLTGHFVPEEAPEETARALLEFFKAA
jgi:haloacetate dehalogenase